MTNDPHLTPVAFGPEHAATYDSNFAGLSAIKEAIHLVMRAHFSALPDDARILVAGAGTSAEVRHLAAQFPSWQFTLADPSSAMLDIARTHAETEGFIDRCKFHADFVSTLKDGDFDGATSLLVSHFLRQTRERTDYFRSIYERLKPGARILNVDLCADTDTADFPSLMSLWKELLTLNGISETAIATYQTAYGRDFACHGPADVAAMIEAAGFDRPVQCFQTALMRGWITNRQR